MKMVAFVGDSTSGKTRLIARLVPELQRRGLKVAIVKHCGHGFDLGGQEKDSTVFISAGAERVALAGPGRTAVIEKKDFSSDLGALARACFADADLVLVEGGKSDSRLRKIEVLRKGVSDQVRTAPAGLEAIVADFPIRSDVPVFHPDDVQAMAGWLVHFVRRVAP